MFRIVQRILLGLTYILILPLSAAASGRGDQELVKAGSWVYDAITSLALEEGKTDFSDQAPLTVKELLSFLDEIDYDALSSAGQMQYDRVMYYFAEQDIAFRSDIFSFGVAPELNLEGYYKSGDELGWVYDRYERQPLILLPVKFQAQDWFTMEMDLQLAQKKTQMSKRSGYNYTNIPFAGDQIDVNFPYTAYFSTGLSLTEKAAMNFQLGMGEQSVGRSVLGSVIQSEYFTGASYANLELFTPDFRYNMNVTQFNVDKYLYTHRFDVRLFRKVQLSVQESVLVNAPLELRFLNPLTIFHGMAPWRDYEPEKDDSEGHTCAYLAVKASYVPVRYLRIYGLFAQDQLQTAYEMENWPDNVTPNGLGAQLGVEGYVPLGGGYLHAAAEASYTDPYFYIKESPNWSLVRTYSDNGTTGGVTPLYEWIGSPFGPDTMAAALDVGYEVPGHWSLRSLFLVMAQGEYADYNVFDSVHWGGQKTAMTDDELKSWVYPDTGKPGGKDYAKKQQSWTSPFGRDTPPQYTIRASLRAGYTPFAFPALSLMAQPSYVLVLNYGNEEGRVEQGFEFALSANFRFGKLFQ